MQKPKLQTLSQTIEYRKKVIETITNRNILDQSELYFGSQKLFDFVT